MKRHNGSGKFSASGFADEEINPMDGVANLADVMLVFACGLMLALITFWNLDVAGLKSDTEPDITPQMLNETADDLQMKQDEELSRGELEEYGTVWRDQETGLLYLVAEG